MNEDPLKESNKTSEKPASPTPTPLPYAPKDVWLYILSLLDPSSLARFSSVSKGARLLAADNRLWKPLLGDLSSLDLKNEKINYKELAALKIIYFDRRKDFFKKTHQASLEPPPLSEEKKTPLSLYETYLGKKTPMETFEALVTNGTQEELNSFITYLNKVKRTKNPTLGTVLRILHCALNNSSDIFKIVCQYIFQEFSLEKYLLDKNLWLFVNFFQHEIPVETFLINGYHPIFRAIDKEQWLLVEFFAIFYPSWLGLTGNLNWRDTRTHTVIEYIFEKNLTLGISLMPFCYFLNKTLLSTEVKRLLAIKLTEKDLPNFKIFAPFSDLTNFKFDYDYPTFTNGVPTFSCYTYVSILDYYINEFKSNIDTDNSVYKVCEILVSHCQSIINNDIDKQNNTVLHHAANLKLLRTCELLLKYGADSNKTNTEDNTFLHLLMNHYWLDKNIDALNEFLPLLVNQYGADLTKINNEGKTPIAIALEKHNTMVLKILILECHASKFITEEDIEVSYKNIDVKNQILVNEKNALLLILHQQKRAEKRQLEYNIAAAGGIIKPKEKNIQLDELDPDTSFMGITRR